MAETQANTVATVAPRAPGTSPALPDTILGLPLPDQRRLLDVGRQRVCRRSLLEFMRATWRRPREPLQVGRHTREIAARLTRAVEDYRRGKSTRLRVVVPFRHGKSDLVSRYLPAWFLGQFPDAEAMLAGYAADLTQGFSRDVRAIITAEEYAAVFPSVTLDPTTNNAAERRIAGHTGRLYAIGRGGAATGRGAALLVVDDLLKNREEAESEMVRKSAWSCLTDDLLTRLAPVHIVVVCNTRWHVDDPTGRIIRRTDPASQEYDPAFPEFESLTYSARQPDGTYLHEERFGRAWYEGQYATLGTYGSAGLLDGHPTLRGGNLLHTDKLLYVDTMPDGLAWVRLWDLASTEEERVSPDPDWTAGALVAVGTDAAGVETIYVDDWQLIRAEAPARDKLIRETARKDAQRGIPTYIEAVAGYKDSYTTLRDALKGIAVVHRVSLAGDKVVRAGKVEPHFDAGHVVMRRGPWVKEAVTQLGEFPSGRHDDCVDVVSSGYVAALDRAAQLRGIGSAVGRGARLWSAH